MMKDGRSRDKKLPRRYYNYILLFVNVVLIVAAVVAYSLYTSAYDERSQQENLSNITNLNRSSALNVNAFIENLSIKIIDSEQYIERNGLTLEEAQRYLCDSNSTDTRSFQLVDSVGNCSVLFINDAGEYETKILSYNEYYPKSLTDIFLSADKEATDSKVMFTSGFTSAETGIQSFALYKYVDIVDADGITAYTMMVCMRMDSIYGYLNPDVQNSGYVGQSTCLINNKGDYISRDSESFGSNNFYNLLKARNDLNKAQVDLIKDEVHNKGKGVIFYKKANIVSGTTEDFAFCYEKLNSVDDLDWYCITAVPLSSFRNPNFNASYVVFAVVCLLVLFIIDLVWLVSLNRTMKASMLREYEANKSKSSFLSRMSHEIRTPLNAIIGYNAIAKNELANAHTDVERALAESKTVDCLSKSEIASKHLLTVINDVLDMSAIESGKIKIAHEKFDFKGVITSITTIFYSQARSKGVDFDVIFGDITHEWFIGDQVRTNQILANLLSNAVKFTPEGGRVVLKITQPEPETNAGHLYFKVTDTGIGMTKEYVDRIWTPFEQADSTISRRFGGTGLGLSITKNLVELMGGTINVESAVGVGTTFTMNLFFDAVDDAETNTAYTLSHVNALVVVDEQGSGDYISLLFYRFGAKCTVVSSGANAIHTIEASIKDDNPFTICIVDWHTPETDVIETLRCIKEIKDLDLPIAILTACNYSEIADKVSEFGISRFIAKPLFQSTLFDLLANISETNPNQDLQQSAKADFNGIRVLLAEDNMMNMEIAKSLLKSANFVIEEAWNGEEALQKFVSSPKGSFSLILMDVHMPVLDGLEAARRIRASSHEEAATIPIIAMTADAFAENVSDALSAGMNAHVSKPIELDVLFSTITKFLK